MNLMPWRNADADTKHDVIGMLVIHGLLLGMNIALYAFGNVIALNMLMLEGEALPTALRLIEWVSWNLTNHFLSIFLPSALAILWLDASLYLVIRRRFEKRIATAWRIAATFTLLLPMIFFSLAWGHYLLILADKFAHYS